MVINGLHLLAAIAVIVAVYIAAHYVGWRKEDKDRRLERSVHVNLMKQTGAWS